MSLFLRQSTAINEKVGPFLDRTDGVTPETGLAGSMTVNLSKNGAALGPRNSAGAIAHDASGYYTVPLDTTDTGTAGRLVIEVTDSATHLAVWHERQVISQELWDYLHGVVGLKADLSDGTWDENIVAGHGAASSAGLLLRVLGELISTRANNANLNDLLGVADVALASVVTNIWNAISIVPTAGQNADAIWDEARSGHTTQGSYGEVSFTIVSATAQAGCDVNHIITNLTEVTDDHYVGRIVVFVTGALVGQATDITSYDGATKTLTVTTLTDIPALNDRFIIV